MKAHQTVIVGSVRYEGRPWLFQNQFSYGACLVDTVKSWLHCPMQNNNSDNYWVPYIHNVIYIMLSLCRSVT